MENEAKVLGKTFAEAAEALGRLVNSVGLLKGSIQNPGCRNCRGCVDSALPLNVKSEGPYCNLGEVDYRPDPIHGIVPDLELCSEKNEGLQCLDFEPNLKYRVGAFFRRIFGWLRRDG